MVFPRQITDLKSVDPTGRAGSSPAIGTNILRGERLLDLIQRLLEVQRRALESRRDELRSEVEQSG